MMNKIYSRSISVAIILVMLSFVYACSDDENEDREDAGNGTNQAKLLPIKIFTDLGDNNTKSYVYEYDEDNRLVKIKVVDVINHPGIQNHTSSVYTITYGQRINEEEAPKSILIESTIMSSLNTGIVNREDRYELTYTGSNVEVRLISSKDNSHPDGLGGALGVIVIEVNNKGQITKRTENWDNGLKIDKTFSYNSIGHLTETIENYNQGGITTTTRYQFEEYDDKESIFGAINAPKWFEQLPITLVGGQGINNVLKYTLYFNSQKPSVITTSYTYNSSGYPTSFFENTSGNNAADEVKWIIEYKEPK